MLYVCKNYPECDAYVRVHTGTTIPVGSLANHELRTLRRTAHQYFDQLYLSGMMSKQDAYQWLADLLSAPLSKSPYWVSGRILLQGSQLRKVAKCFKKEEIKKSQNLR